MDQVENAFEMFVGLLRAGRNPDQAAAALRTLSNNDQLVDAVLDRFRAVTQHIITAREPDSLVDRRYLIPWYTGDRPGDLCWPALRARLTEDGFDEGAIRSVDLASTKVVASLPPPWRPEFSGRGLVLGYVQSGKTSNFTAVAAKAADAGYRFVIVLSGIHNSLRRQTQDRLTEQLVSVNPKLWVPLTDSERDFGSPHGADALLSHPQLKILAVVKKHKVRLTNLISWLRSASATARRNCPILVIDDEADQASLNTRGQDERAVINRLVIRLLAQSKVAYVGYSATPFANVFVDPTVPEDLYPRDFIIDLPRPPDYFGPERLFGREPLTDEEYESGERFDGLEVIRYVPDDEVKDFRPPRRKAERVAWDPVIAGSLRSSIVYFILATAARRARGHSGKHSSMLIHTTQYAELHIRYQQPLLDAVRMIGERVRAGDTGDLEAMWSEETGRVPAESEGEAPVSFEELRPHLSDVIGHVRVVIDNYLSDDRLDYSGAPQVVIAVGGNTLSRGLTLEGLIVSFFLRSASAYDTLLQMGRWFGFRRGYADLARIWTTNELAEYFQFLATVEAEIRTDVARYEREDLTPREFAVRVRTHPQLAITSALKMQSAVDAQVSYSGRRLQTILFNHRDGGWLLNNQEVARALVVAAGGPSAEDIGRGRYLYRAVPHTAVEAFLARYKFHPDSQDLVAERILAYIAGQVTHSELLQWNVGIVGREDLRWAEFDLGTGPGNPVGLINRAAVRAVAKPHANIKSLMSHEDRVMDLGLPPEEVKKRDDAELQALRPKGTGLLILYPINKDSVPQRNSASRTALEAVEHVIGVGLVFPDASRLETKVNYKSVSLAPGDIDEPEEVDPDTLDTESGLDEVPVP